MPNFAGTWKMRSSENFDELLKALGVNAMLRKVAVAAASKPHVEIRQDGDQFYIKTSTTVRTTEINFKVGEGFEEETVDGRKCRSLPTWENENKIHCTQTLLEGDGPKTYWTRELANDELILVSCKKSSYAESTMHAWQATETYLRVLMDQAISEPAAQRTGLEQQTRASVFTVTSTSVKMRLDQQA
ncbi:hypothetical protein STEG23_012402 [Scotinomys teguina]